MALDGAGNLYIADSGNNVIRMINAATGVISTVAGNGAIGNSNLNQVGDGGLATAANLNLPQGVTLDGSGNLYIADTNNHRIREVSAATGNISTIAGSGFTNPNGTGGYNGDNITAITAELNFPYAVAFDAAGNMYIPDSANHRVREVLAVSGVITASSNITTFAGTGQPGATLCTATPVASHAGRCVVSLRRGRRCGWKCLHRGDAKRRHPQSERARIFHCRIYLYSRPERMRQFLLQRPVHDPGALRTHRTLS